jgi:purine nucleosidase
MNFPKLSEEHLRQRLAPPTSPVRIVFDTDTKNEIDDQFALAWALLSPQQITIEAVVAVPFSFQYRIDELARAHEIQSRGNFTNLSAADQELYGRYEEQLARLKDGGIHPRDLIQGSPADGMQRSYDEILLIYEKLGLSAQGKVFRGSDRYLTSLDDPVRSPGAERLVELALASPDESPLYIVGTGCATDIAAALLLEPEIVKKIVVTWTSGFPTTVNRPNYSFNLEQDLIASKLMFDSGVPLVYLPGFHIGAQLRLSLPEMEQWVKGKGAIGDYLYWLYMNNPIRAMEGITDHYGRTWIIWDLINVAWLLNPKWLPSELIPAAVLGNDKKWRRDVPGRHLIREAYEIDRDAIFRDFFKKLESAP